MTSSNPLPLSRALARPMSPNVPKPARAVRRTSFPGLTNASSPTVVTATRQNRTLFLVFWDKQRGRRLLQAHQKRSACCQGHPFPRGRDFRPGGGDRRVGQDAAQICTVWLRFNTAASPFDMVALPFDILTLPLNLVLRPLNRGHRAERFLGTRCNGDPAEADTLLVFSGTSRSAEWSRTRAAGVCALNSQ
jgi:hypothetical protein